MLGGVGLLVAAGVLAVRDPQPTGRLDPAASSAEPPQQQQAPTSQQRAGAGTARRSKTTPDVQKAVPVRIVIPGIDVSAPVIPLGYNPDRTLEVPKNYEETGWFRPGPEPGERGGAMIAGHVDSKTGPAVFYRLRMLRKGDPIEVHLQDSSIVRFVVRSSMAVPKDSFPTDLVYHKKPYATLALVTCGGVFDHTTGHYRDNYIVFADLDQRH